MNVLVVGSGGREHALAWKLAQSEKVTRVFIAPGNGGTRFEPKCINVDIAVDDFPTLTNFVRRYRVELTVVGPEAPMADGIRDHFDQNELPCIAPTKLAAQLESSKSFAKAFMQRQNIPTAPYQLFSDADKAINYLNHCDLPIVIKADGLAAGKGVVVAHSLEDAVTAVQEIMVNNQFGQAGHTVVIEQYLTGVEASYIVLSDGKNYQAFASSQDHKPVFDGNQGPNTGGMGAYSPAPAVTPEIETKIQEQIIQPCIEGMAREEMPFQGFLYAGLMISPDQEVHVVEFNCRFGDPEAQPVLYRLKSDLAELCLAALDQQLDQTPIEFFDESALGVVLATDGYPGNYQTGMTIEGLDQHVDNSKVFHAGTQHENDAIHTTGGRVLCVVGKGKDLQTARDLAYDRSAQIKWDGQHYRSDIGFQALNT